MGEIDDSSSREILVSRGNPPVEVEVYIEDGLYKSRGKGWEQQVTVSQNTTNCYE